MGTITTYLRSKFQQNRTTNGRGIPFGLCSLCLAFLSHNQRQLFHFLAFPSKGHTLKVVFIKVSFWVNSFKVTLHLNSQRGGKLHSYGTSLLHFRSFQHSSASVLIISVGKTSKKQYFTIAQASLHQKKSLGLSHY